jgi:hypothetical protein
MRTAIRAHPGGRSRDSEELASLATGPVLVLTGCVGAALLVLSWRSGFSGGELSMLAAGRHLAWGYADRPAMLPALSRLLDTLTGGSPIGVRLPGTVLASAGVVVTALIAREFGGGRYAQILASAVYASSAATLGTGYLLAASTVDAFLWTTCGWLLVRWARTGDNRLSIWLGVVTSVALQTEYLILLLWAVLAIALLTVGPRQLATRPGPWIAVGCALLTTLPEFTWQARHDWPFQSVPTSIERDPIHATLTFLPLLLLAAGLFAGAAGALYGLARLLGRPELSRYAFLGWTAIGVTAAFLVLTSRPYYVVGLFPVLWAVAAADLERHPLPSAWRWLAGWPVLALSALLALPGAPGLPGWAGWPRAPIAPVAWLTRDHVVVRAGPVDPRVGPRLNQAGWTGFAAEVARVYHGLPAESREHVVIITRGVWGASALDRFGPAFGLPPVYCAKRNYWYFGAPPEDAERVLYVGEPSEIRPHFDELRLLGTVPEAVPGTATFPAGTQLWLAEGRRAPWSRLWPELRGT